MRAGAVNKAILCFFVVFIAWISFIPEPLQERYRISVYAALVLMLVFSLCMRGYKVRAYFFAKQDLFFWIYLLLLSANIWFAKDSKVALDFYKEFSVIAVAIYFLIKNEVRFLGAKRIFYPLVIAAALVSIGGVLEMLARSNVLYERYVATFCYRSFIGHRMMSTLVHPNVLGCYLIAVLPVAYYFYRSESLRGKRVFMLSIFCLLSVALLLTFSRGTWVSALMMASVWFLLKKKIKGLMVAWVAFMLLILIASLPFFEYSTLGRLGVERLRMHLHYGNRPLQYITTAHMLHQHPFVGIGLYHYRALYNQYAPRRLPYELMIPESIYLMHLAEAGIVGFLGFALFLGSLLRKAYTRYRRLEGDNKDMFFAMVMGFVGPLFNMAWFDGFLWKTPLYLFWLFAGLITGMSRTTVKNQEAITFPR